MSQENVEIVKRALPCMERARPRRLRRPGPRHQRARLRDSDRLRFLSFAPGILARLVQMLHERSEVRVEHATLMQLRGIRLQAMASLRVYPKQNYADRDTS